MGKMKKKIFVKVDISPWN